MKKVIDKFSAAFNGEIAVMYIDSEENEKAMQALEVERVPTILVIKHGKVSAKKTGLMNPKELKAIYTKA
jgi:thioredoxin 1